MKKNEKDEMDSQSIPVRPRTILDMLAFEKHVALVELKKKAERAQVAVPPYTMVDVKPLPHVVAPPYASGIGGGVKRGVCSPCAIA